MSHRYLGGYITATDNPLSPNFAVVPAVTSGLVFYVDAANTSSYPGTGTTWNDTSASAEVGTLVGSPTFTGTSFTYNGSTQ